MKTHLRRKILSTNSTISYRPHKRGVIQSEDRGAVARAALADSGEAGS